MIGLEPALEVAGAAQCKLLRTLAGLREPPRPEEMVLGANYGTPDPEAGRRARRLYKKMLYLERHAPELSAQEEAERAVARTPE